MRLRCAYLGPELFVQVYINVMTGTQNFALILGRERLYGCDCVDVAWHRHPYGDPGGHDFSPEGVQPVTVAEFLSEVREIVEEAELL